MADHYLMLDGWAGRTLIPCEIVGETPKRTRIKLLERARLPGNRWFDAGQVALVPTKAVCSKPSVFDARK